jgi:hypothetical protein
MPNRFARRVGGGAGGFARDANSDDDRRRNWHHPRHELGHAGCDLRSRVPVVVALGSSQSGVALSLTTRISEEDDVNNRFSMFLFLSQ